MTLQEAKQKISQLDWQYFQSQNMPDLALLIRMASDYNYQEFLANGDNSKNDPLVKAGSLVSNRLVTLIPVVGDILGFILDGTGIDFSIIGTLGDSGTARQRMWDWVHTLDGSQGFQKIYESDLDYLTDDSVYPSNVQVVFSQVGTRLFNARPQCVSPSSNCVGEHQRYIARTHICKESQEALILLYLQNFNNTNWRNFISQFRVNTPPSQGGNIPGTQNKGMLGAGVILGLIGLASKFGKG